jgi:recombination protein RecA
VKRSGAWYSYGEDVRLGQGRENAKIFLAENPDIAEELETRLRVALGMVAPADTEAAGDEEPAESEVASAD